MDIDRSGLDEPLVAPDALEQAVPRQDAVPVVHEKSQQLEFAPRQANRLAVDCNRDRVKIRPEVLALIDGGRLREQPVAGEQHVRAPRAPGG